MLLPTSEEHCVTTLKTAVYQTIAPFTLDLACAFLIGKEEERSEKGRDRERKGRSLPLAGR